MFHAKYVGTHAAFRYRGGVPSQPHIGVDALKEKLLLMAAQAETALDRALKALIKRDDDLARQAREDDTLIDRLEIEIDGLSLVLLQQPQDLFSVRLITMAMKIAHDLERVGDEATTISRRCLDLSKEPALRQIIDIPHIGQLAVRMLKDSLDSFVNHDPGQARRVINQDDEVDDLNQRLQDELQSLMRADSSSVTRCLNLVTISKCLERVADHATSIAEMVVYLYEGHDIRHPKLADRDATHRTALAHPDLPNR